MGVVPAPSRVLAVIRARGARACARATVISPARLAKRRMLACAIRGATPGTLEWDPFAGAPAPAVTRYVLTGSTVTTTEAHCTGSDRDDSESQ